MPATKTRKTKARRDMYAEMTQAVLDALEQGHIPWEKPWTGGADAPRSIHGRPYRGMNAFWLGYIRAVKGYGSPYWITFNQAKQRGGTVRKGEKGAMVLLYKWYDREDPETGETKRAFFLTSFTVFNVDQCDGIEAPAVETKTFDPIERAEEILDGMPNRPVMKSGGDRAWYSPVLDLVQLPTREQFKTSEGFYFVAYHELAHSTGHESRLERKGITENTNFGEDLYAQEELVAEMTSAFLGAEAGITAGREIDNRAAYIQNWMAALKNDTKLLVRAAGQAQKAADYILGSHPEEATE